MKSSLLNLISPSFPFTFLLLRRQTNQTKREGRCHEAGPFKNERDK